jgi:hypothetical protein
MSTFAEVTPIIVSETEPIITPRNPNSQHNFGPVSPREKTLFTAERPGHPGLDGVPTEIVEDWIAFIKSKGIRHVLIIMEVRLIKNQSLVM